MSIWIQKGRLLTGCLLNAAVFFFSPLSQSALFLVFLSILEVYTFTGDHPLQTGTMLALGSRDLGSKGAKAKSRRGVFPWMGWKVWLRLGSHRDTGKARRGGYGREIYFCSLAPGPVSRPMYQKRPPRLRRAHRPMHDRMHNAGDFVKWWM